jgi:carbonyl reductase 1
MPRRYRVALVTGGTKGIGYMIGKEMLRKIPSSFAFLTSRGETSGMDSILGMELGGGARKRAKFITMDVRNQSCVKEHADAIIQKYGGVDILINNAAIFEKPDLKNFHEQAIKLLKTNYWGTKNVIKAFFHEPKENARMINITSNLAHVKEKQTCEVETLKARTRNRFLLAKNLFELDGLVLKFEDDVFRGRCKDEGWPECAFSVSKMAVNAYTRLLQEDLDEQGRKDVVVNAVYPATKHSKINQDGFDLITREQAAQFVFYMATTMPNNPDRFPRGEVIFENSMAVFKDNKDRSIGS